MTHSGIVSLVGRDQHSFKEVQISLNEGKSEDCFMTL